MSYTEFNELINYFFDKELPVTVSTGKSGYNNTTRYLYRNGKKYIMRIYETHKEEAKVLLEHEVLMKLNLLPKLPFSIPFPVIEDGKSILRLPSKKIGCIYHYIEGDNPVFNIERELYSFGRSVGHLLQAFEELDIHHPFIYRPYYEIEHSHPNCPVNEVVEWCHNPPELFKEYKKQLLWIASQLLDFKKYVPQLNRLPHQIIHGDLNASNVLVNNDQEISAVLDFEFSTRDLRIMEVAVCISDIISEEEETKYLEKVRHFFSGLASTLKVTSPEIEALPILVQLRRLDVFLHFLGRYFDGKDEASVLVEQIQKAAAYEHWINEGGRKIVQLWGEVNL